MKIESVMPAHIEKDIVITLTATEALVLQGALPLSAWAQADQAEREMYDMFVDVLERHLSGEGLL